MERPRRDIQRFDLTTPELESFGVLAEHQPCLVGRNSDAPEATAVKIDVVVAADPLNCRMSEQHCVRSAVKCGEPVARQHRLRHRFSGRVDKQIDIGAGSIEKRVVQPRAEGRSLEQDGPDTGRRQKVTGLGCDPSC